MKNVLLPKSTATRIYEDIRKAVDNDESLKSYTYIVMGKTGPTGKTYMVDRLKALGCNVVELSELIFDVVEYDDSNYYRVDAMQKTVVIILNQRLDRGDNYERRKLPW